MKSSYGLSQMQIALLGAGVGTFSQAVKVNSEVAHKERQSRIESAYKAASRKIASGNASKETFEKYNKLKKLVSPAIRRNF